MTTSTASPDPSQHRHDPTYTDRLQYAASCAHHAPTGVCKLFACSCPFMADVDRCNRAAREWPAPKILRQPGLFAHPRDPAALDSLRFFRTYWMVQEVFNAHPQAVILALADKFQSLLEQDNGLAQVNPYHLRQLAIVSQSLLSRDEEFQSLCNRANLS